MLRSLLQQNVDCACELEIVNEGYRGKLLAIFKCAYFGES
jgi:hypothetical protein